MDSSENSSEASLNSALSRSSGALQQRARAVSASRHSKESTRVGPLGFSALILCGVILSFVAHTVSALLSGSTEAVVPKQSQVALSNDQLRSSYFRLLGQKREQDNVNQVRALQGFILRYSRVSHREALELARVISRESEQANINPWFVAAVVKSESNFRVHAVSSAGARGLMQLLPSTGRYIAEKNGIPWQGNSALFEPEYNVKLGIAYLQYLRRYFGENQDHLLVAYNWGPTNTRRAIARRGNFPSVSRRYASTILRDFEAWSSASQRSS